MRKNAIVLCSGGLDSVTTAFYVKKILRYPTIEILFFNYKQRNLLKERAASKYCAKILKANWQEIALPFLTKFSNSLLHKSSVPSKLDRCSLNNTKKESEKWYVPMRNLIFLSAALSYADFLYSKDKKKSDIFVGFKCEGKESYPDTTPLFIKEINSLSKISTSAKSRVIAPLIRKDKEDIVILAKKLNVPIEKTWSCYLSYRKQCGTCLACLLRKEGFYWANQKDDTLYLK